MQLRVEYKRIMENKKYFLLQMPELSSHIWYYDNTSAVHFVSVHSVWKSNLQTESEKKTPPYD